jgi:inhibitor of cysteine peptidase
MRRLSLAALLALFVSAAPAAAKTVRLTEEDSGKKLRVRAGDRVVIRLAENPSTGYRWKVTRRPDRVVARVTRSKYEAEPTESEGGPPVVGSGGTRTVRLRAVGAGRTAMRLTYVAAGDRPNGGRFRVTLRVRQAG